MLVSALWTVLGVSALLLVYPFAIYPLLLRLLRAEAPPQARGPLPRRVALVFAARDEAADLPRTLRILSMVRMHWPDLQILAWNDGSRDGTGRLLRGARSLVRARHAVHPVGKAEGLRRLIDETDAEILVLMDANTRFRPEALRTLVAPFADPSVGAVGARLVPCGAAAGVGRAYWALEERIKRLETRSGSTIGCDGALWAIRAELYPRFGAAAADDFRPSMEALLAGRRVISVPQVEVREAAVPDRHGFARAARIACGAWHAHRQIRARLHRLSPRDRFKYVSHKLLRWFSGLWLLTGGAAALALAGLYGHGAAAAVLLGAGLAGAALGLPGPATAWRICQGFLGTTWGVLRAMRGGTRVRWTPVRA
ncbi:glycosyltransferase [Rhodobacteraceae bacterium 2CG4]|uniref:Glycosyltransferase n=1 Tax=Halovulum marinum TaxID=2662447 RepID=A0A6L5Z239_9RHOB|nr:glycosyltransferase [Halovulum marinum]MSU90641.1 glycosyltransferase [Halovulum marinum]